MAADVRDQTATIREEPSLADMLVVFRRGAALVDAALAALAAIAPKVDAIKTLAQGSDAPVVIAPHVTRSLQSLGLMLATAEAEGDNLLFCAKGRATAQPLVVFTLARQAAGNLSVQSIEIDRAAIALTDGSRRDSSLIFDRLCRAGVDLANPHLEGAVDMFRVTLDAFRSHTLFAASRLSIAKARFDLQASLLSGVAQADAASSAARLEGHLAGTGARDMAVETRRLLSRQSMNIANGNREALRSLLQQHVAPSKT